MEVAPVFVVVAVETWHLTTSKLESDLTAVAFGAPAAAATELDSAFVVAAALDELAAAAALAPIVAVLVAADWPLTWFARCDDFFATRAGSTNSEQLAPGRPSECHLNSSSHSPVAVARSRATAAKFAAVAD